MEDMVMFVKLTAVVNRQEREVFLAVSKIFGVSKSDDLGVTYVLSDTGHGIMVKDSVEDVLQKIKEIKNNVDKIETV